MKEYKPFLSVLIVIFTLFAVVIIQMEERRRGYAILKITREEKLLQEKNHSLKIKIAKLMNPEHVHDRAQKEFPLKKVEDSQIIHLGEMEE